MELGLLFWPPGNHQSTQDYPTLLGWEPTWMLGLELGHIIDILVHDDPKIIGLGV